MSLPEDRKRRWHYHTFSFRKENLTKGEDDMDSNAFLNDLMSKMKLPEAKGKKKAEQSESVAQILAAMQKVKTEKKKPPVTSYAPTKEMPVNEPESMEEFSQLASDVMQECWPAIPAVKTSISEQTVRVAAYIRVSSTNPAQEDSYEMQERYFMSLLAGNAGWTSAGIYSDHGISATSREGRTGFNRLLRHCKQGKIDRVICKSISRFARNTHDFLVALRILKENNVTILFEREAMDTADAYSEFILTTLAAIAQEESRSISANIAWSNQKRFPAGNVCNKDIYGYEFRKGEYTVNENGYRYRAVFIIPEEAEIVRMVFRLFTKEELGFTQIAQKLDTLHIQPPNSGCRQRQKRKPTVLPAGALKEEDKRGWTATDVRYIIANVRYCGSVLCQKTYTDHRNGHKQKVNKGEKPKYLIRNHHPAIISEELWQEAQEVWKAYTAKYRGIEKGRNERNYSKLLLCGECGRYFQGHSTTRTTIWRCATKLAQQGQKRCRMESIYEEQIQALLRKAFAEKFKLGEKMDAEVHEVMQMISKVPIDSARNQALKNLTEKLREIHDFDQMEQEGDFLKRQLSAVNYSIRDVHQHIRDIQAEKEALKVRCEVLGEPIDKEAVTELENRLLNEEEQLEKLEHEAQQQAEQVRYMEDYWKKLEQTHEIREKTLQWLDSLAGGTQMFLDEAVGTYVKAFVLSVTIFSPKHFRIHWFDDTCTEVECDSVFEGYQQPGMIRRKY